MPRVRSIVQILIAVALLAACAPATPAPTAVPPTVTAAPTNTVAPTATLAPTLTPSPTETPTPAPTQEDFSDIEYASSIDEAMEKKPVSRDDVLDGRLIRYAKSMAKPWPEGAEPVTFTLKDIDGNGTLIFLPDQENPSIQDMGTYRYDDGDGYGGLLIKVIRFLQPNGQDGYYQLSIDMNMYANDPRTLSSVKMQPYLLPIYKTSATDSDIGYLTEWSKRPNYTPNIELLWETDYYEKVQPLMNEWQKTGIIPEDLSLLPLYHPTRIRY